MAEAAGAGAEGDAARRTTTQVHVRYRNRYGRERAYYAGFEGVVPFLERRHAETESEW